MHFTYTLYYVYMYIMCVSNLYVHEIHIGIIGESTSRCADITCALLHAHYFLCTCTFMYMYNLHTHIFTHVHVYSTICTCYIMLIIQISQ